MIEAAYIGLCDSLVRNQIDNHRRALGLPEPPPPSAKRQAEIATDKAIFDVYAAMGSFYVAGMLFGRSPEIVAENVRGWGEVQTEMLKLSVESSMRYLEDSKRQMREAQERYRKQSEEIEALRLQSSSEGL